MATPKEIRNSSQRRKRLKKGMPEMRRFQDRIEMIRGGLCEDDPNRFGGRVQVEGGTIPNYTMGLF